MSSSRVVTVVLVLCLVAGIVTNPVRRSPDLEARRRSAIDRSMIRFGRSYPAEPSAAELREAFQRPARKGNSFLRFGRSQPVALTSDELLSLLKSYEEDYDTPVDKRVSNFVRFGRDPKFIRLGRSGDEKVLEQTPDMIVNGYPERKHRARDHFIRLGRDSEEISGNDSEEMTDERKKRSAECHECQS